MRSDICSIPINEIFEPKEGCPICRMYNVLEERLVDYTMGGAMMEPEIRIETNKKGFCHHHYEMMFERRNKLGLALIISTHLAEIKKKVYGQGGLKKASKVNFSKGSKITDTCFICEKLSMNINALMLNLCKHYEDDRDFRKLYSEQETICLPHVLQLLEFAEGHLSKKYRAQFKKDTFEISCATLEELESDVLKFCEMYDYRNNTEDADWGNSKDSVERCIKWLCSKE